MEHAVFISAGTAHAIAAKIERTRTGAKAWVYQHKVRGELRGYRVLYGTAGGPLDVVTENQAATLLN